MKPANEQQQTSRKPSLVATQGSEMLTRGRRRPWGSSKRINNNEVVSDKPSISSELSLTLEVKPAERGILCQPVNPAVAACADGKLSEAVQDQQEEFLEGDGSGSEGIGCMESLIDGNEINSGVVSIQSSGNSALNTLSIEAEVFSTKDDKNCSRTGFIPSISNANEHLKTPINKGSETGEIPKSSCKTAIRRVLVNIRRKRRSEIVGRVDSSYTPESPASMALGDPSKFKICIIRDSISEIRKVIDKQSGSSFVMGTALLNNNSEPLEEEDEEENEFERIIATSFHKAAVSKEPSYLLGNIASVDRAELRQDTSTSEPVQSTPVSAAVTSGVPKKAPETSVSDTTVLPRSKKLITKKTELQGKTEMLGEISETRVFNDSSNGASSDNRDMQSGLVSSPINNRGRGLSKGVRRKSVVTKRKQDSSSDEQTTDGSDSGAKKTKRNEYNPANNCSSVSDMTADTMEDMDIGVSNEYCEDAEVSYDAAQPDAFVFDMVDNDDYLISDGVLESEFDSMDKHSQAVTTTVGQGHSAKVFKGHSDKVAQGHSAKAIQGQATAHQGHKFSKETVDRHYGTNQPVIEEITNDSIMISTNESELLNLVNNWIESSKKGSFKDLEDSMSVVIENYFKSDRVATVHHLLQIGLDKLMCTGITNVPTNNKLLSTSDASILNNIKCICDIGLTLLHKLLDHGEKEAVGSLELICSACITSRYVEGLVRIRTLVCEGVVQWYNKQLLYQCIYLLAREACLNPVSWEEFGGAAIDLALCGVHSGVYLPLPSSSCRTLIIYSWLSRDEMRLVLCAYMKTVAQTSTRRSSSSKENSIADAGSESLCDMLDTDKDFGKWVVRITKQSPSLMDESVKALIAAEERNIDVASALSVLETVINEDLEPACFQCTRLGLNTIEILSCRMSQVLSILPANVKLDCCIDWSKCVTNEPPVKYERKNVSVLASTSPCKSLQVVSKQASEDSPAIKISVVQNKSNISKMSASDNTNRSKVESLTKESKLIIKKNAAKVPNRDIQKPTLKKPLAKVERPVSTSITKPVNSLQRSNVSGRHVNRKFTTKSVSASLMTSTPVHSTISTLVLSGTKVSKSPVSSCVPSLLNLRFDSINVMPRLPSEMQLHSCVQTNFNNIMPVRLNSLPFSVVPNPVALMGRRASLPQSNINSVGTASSLQEEKACVGVISIDEVRNFPRLPATRKLNPNRNEIFSWGQQTLDSGEYNNIDGNVRNIDRSVSFTQPTDSSPRHQYMSLDNSTVQYSRQNTLQSSGNTMQTSSGILQPSVGLWQNFSSGEGLLPTPLNKESSTWNGNPAHPQGQKGSGSRQYDDRADNIRNIDGTVIAGDSPRRRCLPHDNSNVQYSCQNSLQYYDNITQTSAGLEKSFSSGAGSLQMLLNTGNRTHNRTYPQDQQRLGSKWYGDRGGDMRNIDSFVIQPADASSTDRSLSSDGSTVCYNRLIYSRSPNATNLSSPDKTNQKQMSFAGAKQLSPIGTKQLSPNGTKQISCVRSKHLSPGRRKPMSFSGAKPVKRPGLLQTPEIRGDQEQKRAMQRSQSNETFNDRSENSTTTATKVKPLMRNVGRCDTFRPGRTIDQSDIMSNRAVDQSDISEEEFAIRVSESIKLRLQFHVREGNVPQSIDSLRTAECIAHRFFNDFSNTNNMLSRKDATEVLQEYIDWLCKNDNSFLVSK